MSNFDSDGGPENGWDDRGELAWNEFDWERYLREQDEVIERYVRLYENIPAGTDRIDRVAEKMDWGDSDWSDDSDDDEDDDDDSGSDAEVYTLHKNPIFIATKAIYQTLDRSWQQLAVDGAKVPQAPAVALLASLHRGEEQAVHAIHALDFGDYAMAVSLFKRSLGALNASLAIVSDDALGQHPQLLAWRELAVPRLFDLREVWLRVIAECREELERPADDEN